MPAPDFHWVTIRLTPRLADAIRNRMIDQAADSTNANRRAVGVLIPEWLTDSPLGRDRALQLPLHPPFLAEFLLEANEWIRPPFELASLHTVFNGFAYDVLNAMDHWLGTGVLIPNIYHRVLDDDWHGTRDRLIEVDSHFSISGRPDWLDGAIELQHLERFDEILDVLPDFFPATAPGDGWQGILLRAHPDELAVTFERVLRAIDG